MPAHGLLVAYLPEGVAETPDDGREAIAEWCGRIGLSGGRAVDVTVAVPTGGGPRVASRAAWGVPVGPAASALARLEWHGPVWASSVPASLRCWALATRLATRLVAAELVLPDLVEDEGQLFGVWRAAVEADDEAHAAVASLARALPPAAAAIALSDDRVWDPPHLVQAWLDAVVDATVRAHTPDPSPTRPRERILPWTARWTAALTDRVDASVPLRGGAAELVAGVAAWRASLGVDTTGGRAELHLVAPDTAEGPWRLTFGVRADDGQLVTAADVWADAGQEAHRTALLTGLARCARVFPRLETVLDEEHPEAVDLDVDQAWRFISEVADLVDGQVIVRLPDDVREGDLRLRLHIGADAPGDDAPGDDAPGDDHDPDEPGAVPDEAVLTGTEHARWEVALGDEALDDAALDALLAADAPLVHFRGRWVRVDPEVARHARVLAPPRLLPFAEALGLAMAGSTEPDTELPVGAVDVVASGRVDDLLKRIRTTAERPGSRPEPDGFVGTLRPYQRRGVAWLAGMAGLGLGGVLADEMGLGKTVQLIAHLLDRPHGPHLIVCPTSVVGNWERELHRFAPSLAVVRHHGPDRADTPYRDDVVVVTSYGTLRRDAEQLAATAWDVVTLDEAQFVKNPSTAGARAVRELTARQTVAMTGTPLENRLAELWSLLDATNAGIVGSRAAFGRRYVAPVERRRDRSAARRLRRLVAPFVLRREKSDPDVAAELPDRIDRTVVCPLTAEQATAYRQATQRALDEVERLDGMRRRGRVLALLTELKQICNHPVHHDLARAGDRKGSDGAGPDAGALVGRSGKFETARAIVAEAVGAGAQVLVFSQYVQMTRLLARQLGADLGTDVPVLHGGLSAGARDRLVAGFQGQLGDPPPVLVVSLRAGGTGLNLTAATHVVHFDRWWNPAVEDQATDRAHRIGQRSTVEVHKLVTAGTVEERIAELLDAKRDLADSVVGAGESWITELADAELAELVALARDTETMEYDDLDPLVEATLPTAALSGAS